MFFFESIPWYNVLMWLVVLGMLIGLNEISRLSKGASIVMFIVVPVILTPFWLKSGDEITSWFTWIKVYSALAGCLIYMVIRFTDYHKENQWYLLLVPAILGINILEAAARELQVGLAGFEGMIDGMYYISGGWNYANALAGFLNLILICGWVGIHRKTTGKRKDMVWPDQTLLWIIAYAVWNVSYVYSCAPGNALYSGVALNLAAIIPAVCWAKGSWMQHRAHTLAFWMMWVMTNPYFFAEGSKYYVRVSYNPAANWTLALAALALNGYLAYRQFSIIRKNKLNPFKDQVWTDSKA